LRSESKVSKIVRVRVRRDDEKEKEQFAKNMKPANKSSYKLCKSLFYILFYCRYEIMHTILDGFEIGILEILIKETL
jgi:hypothetical protein